MTANNTIEISRQHHLSLADAHNVANELAGKLEARLGISARWEGEQLHLAHPSAQGTLTLDQEAVHLKLQLSALFAMMRPMIEAEIQRYFDKRFGA